MFPLEYLKEYLNDHGGPGDLGHISNNLSPDQKLIYTRARSLGDNHVRAMKKALK